VYRYLWCAFRHSWILSQGAWTSPSALVYCRWHAVCIALSLWRDILTLSFKCWFSIRLGCTQQKTGQVHVEGLVEKMETVPNRSLKENVWSCSFQQWHPRRLGCDRLSIQIMYSSGRQHFLQNRPSTWTLFENLPLPMISALSEYICLFWK